MVAKWAGGPAGILVTMVWFWSTGTRPVKETVVWLLFGPGGGFIGYRLVDRAVVPCGGCEL